MGLTGSYTAVAPLNGLTHLPIIVSGKTKCTLTAIGLQRFNQISNRKRRN